MDGREGARRKLVEARRRLGLSQTRMAEELETSLRTYQRWEAGTTEVPGGALFHACELVNSPSNGLRLAALKKK